MRDILDLINRINKLHNEEYYEITGDYAPLIFTQKHCYYYALLLQKFYPDGELVINKEKTHIAIKIDNFIYDSVGLLFGEEKNFSSITESDWLTIENYMIPLNEYERNKMERFVDDIYNRIIAINNPSLGAKT